MRFRVTQLLFFIIFLTLYQCKNTNQPPPKTTSQSSVNYSSNFKPLVFEEDNRVAKIQSAIAQFDEIFEAHRQNRKIPGLAYGIVVDSQLVHANAFGTVDLENNRPASIATDFRIASMTKSFTAMAILKLRDEGKLSLEDPVTKFIPEMAQITYLTQDAAPIDIENLLTMTAGFPEDNAWGDRQLSESDQMLMDLVKQGVTFSNVPSYQYEYSNLGYALLGNIISKVAGISYQQYLKENIFLPLGMKNTYWEIDSVPANQLAIGYRWEDEKYTLEPMLHDGSFGSMGGLITTIEDFSKYVSFHLSAWPPRNTSDNGPVKRSSLREMHTPQFVRFAPSATNYKGEACPYTVGYGYGLSINKNCEFRIRISHGGALPGFGSNYMFFPAYGIGIMAFGNLTYTGPLPFSEMEKMLFEVLELSPRELPISEILAKRNEQVLKLVQDWTEANEKDLLAENFYLDFSRGKWIATVEEVFQKAGAIHKINPFTANNQLRGSSIIEAENGEIEVYFTLHPEKTAKVQYLELLYTEN